eukprot:2057868-Amphidinium_carterae.1
MVRVGLVLLEDDAASEKRGKKKASKAKKPSPGASVQLSMTSFGPSPHPKAPFNPILGQRAYSSAENYV